MQLDPALWEALEKHGVTHVHLDMLLQALRVQKNGSLAWHFVHGNLTQCDLRLTFSSRPYDVQRVSEVVLDEKSLIR